ncbi:hypothetical protein L484_021368 [Morus notabilis]|uniref:Uncharacterized protein n=1 Tax=Morus notabilis TaxID=981085 RepID=W9RHS4_9ROSA|nr:hypothetical protein L484_021368 [Morus notabilis]
MEGNLRTPQASTDSMTIHRILDTYSPLLSSIYSPFPIIDYWDPHIHGSPFMAFFAFFKQILEGESSTIYESFKAEFHKILVGAFTLPINIPGTSYYQGMQGRRSIERLLMQIMEERRAAGSQNDMLDRILRDEENNHNLIDEEIID